MAYNYKIKFGLHLDVDELKGETEKIADNIVESNNDSILEKCAEAIENSYDDYDVYNSSIDALYDNSDDVLEEAQNDIISILNDDILPEFIEKINSIIYGDEIIEFMEKQFADNIGAKVEIKRINDITYDIISDEDLSDKLDPTMLEDTIAYEVINDVMNKLYYENNELELDLYVYAYSITINEDYGWRIVEGY